jgi:acyl-CoA thioesterase
MDAVSFLGLEPTEDPKHWRLPVTPGVCTGGNFLFGGAGLGAGIAVLEAAAGRPVVWATAQYLSFARPPEVMDLEATIAAHGHHVTQARVVGRVGDREILTVNGALGRRDDEDAQGQWAVRPDVPLPDECPPRVRWRGQSSDGDDISSRLDVRMAYGRTHDQLDGAPGDGRTALWARMPDLLEMSGAALGILGDYVPSGIGQALGLRAGGRSLDNTVRVARLVPTEWVLLDIRVHAVSNGMGHGLVHQWAEDGTLLATASQSAIVRRWRD